MTNTTGVFLSDIHLPDNINLDPIFSYVSDLYKRSRDNKDKFVVILGGDIIDSKGLHGVESTSPTENSTKLWNQCYLRDCSLLSDFLKKLVSVAPTADVVYLEGNHEERYRRIMIRYPEMFKDKYNFVRDVVSKIFPKAKWIPYGTYSSYYKLGDTIFLHGTIYPTNHAKKYSEVYAPFKVVYGHLHHYQAFTTHNAMPELPAHYALTAGCLTHTAPEWKKGQPNCWITGFVDFFSDGKVTTAAAHIIDIKGRFMVGGKLYQ